MYSGQSNNESFHPESCNVSKVILLGIVLGCEPVRSFRFICFVSVACHSPLVRAMIIKLFSITNAFLLKRLRSCWPLAR